MSLTIYDIAKKAETSVSTVSRYLNKKNIRPEAKARIELVLKENNFKPNVMARALVSKSLKTVAILTVDIRVPHYANIAYSIEQEFSQRGYNVIICNVSGSIDKSVDYIDSLIGRQVDGIVFVGSIFNELNNNPRILEMLKDLPVVMANGTLNLETARSVITDDEYSIMMAYEYLYEKGRRDIYYVVDMDNDSAKNKLAGFEKICKKYGVDFSSHVLSTSHDVDGGARCVDNLVIEKKEFNGIICGEDVCAVGVINELKERDYRVGINVDVIGCNNTIYSTMTMPKMTIIDNKPVLQAKQAVNILEKMIKKEEVASLVITPELVVRGSA